MSEPVFTLGCDAHRKVVGQLVAAREGAALMFVLLFCPDCLRSYTELVSTAGESLQRMFNVVKPPK